MRLRAGTLVNFDGIGKFSGDSPKVLGPAQLILRRSNNQNQTVDKRQILTDVVRSNPAFYGSGWDFQRGHRC
jgi:hypothetical protein